MLNKIPIVCFSLLSWLTTIPTSFFWWPQAPNPADLVVELGFPEPLERAHPVKS